MLNLNCVICSDLFSPSDDVHVTTCGHLFHFVCINQWLERSKTCPQCRNRCTSRTLVRIYFNLANLDVSHIDVGTLQEQLDNANLQIKVKERDLKKAEEDIKKLRETQKKCMKTIAGLEDTVKKKEFIIYSYIEQVKLLKTDAKVVESLRDEIKTLKHENETMEGMSTILAATKSEAEKLLKTESDSRKLSVWVTTLKRELRACESKKTDLRNMLKVVQKQLQIELDTKKKLQERISLLESDNYQLNQKVEALESAQSTSNVISSTSESQSTIKSLIREEKRQTISPTTKDNIKKIEDSNSPYFNIKASSIGLGPFLKRNQELVGKKVATVTTTKLATLKISPKKTQSNNGKMSTLAMNGAVRKFSSDFSEKYSIFKRPRLGMVSSSSSSSSISSIKKPISSNYVFNGFGGSDKIDPFAQKAVEERENAKIERQLPRLSSGGTVDLNQRLRVWDAKSLNKTNY